MDIRYLINSIHKINTIGQLRDTLEYYLHKYHNRYGRRNNCKGYHIKISKGRLQADCISCPYGQWEIDMNDVRHHILKSFQIDIFGGRKWKDFKQELYS